MKRKSFLKHGLMGIGGLMVIPQLSSCCKNEDDDGGGILPSDCAPSPTEIAGPFPIISPSSLVKANIIGDRTGIPLVINLLIQDTNQNCAPVENIKVDIWHCDAKGNYSEYNNQLDGDFTSAHFLRGRQVSNSNGQVTFVSIYPGWYPGRAPHFHLELKNSSNESLLVTQVAFPEDISTHIYATQHYKGIHDTTNASDGGFKDSLDRNIVDEVTGDLTSGYTVTKIIKVSV